MHRPLRLFLSNIPNAVVTNTALTSVRLPFATYQRLLSISTNITSKSVLSQTKNEHVQQELKYINLKHDFHGRPTLLSRYLQKLLREAEKNQSEFKRLRRTSFAHPPVRISSKSILPMLQVKQLTADDTVVYPLLQQLQQNKDILYVVQLLEQAGYEVRIAGGAVRDMLRGVLPEDIDLATTATPDQMHEVFSQHKDSVSTYETKAGRKHGTLIVRVFERSQYEVTTLRMDTQTDGRHAEVQFVTDWEQDASRRDLTINSMFLDLNGQVYDYFDGIKHLQKQKVLFVGNAEDRMHEDYLRILRYFRFFARYGDCAQFDEQTAQAIQACKCGLRQISGERIWTELKKIVGLPNAIFVMPLILDRFNLGPFMGLQQEQKELDLCDKSDQSGQQQLLNKTLDDEIQKQLDEFKRVHYNLYSLPGAKQLRNEHDAITLFTAVIQHEQQLVDVFTRLRWSNTEKDIAATIFELRNTPDLNLQILCKKLVMVSNTKFSSLRTCLLELLRYKGELKMHKRFAEFQVPTFPVDGLEVRNRVQNLTSIGPVLNAVKEHWIDSNFELSKQQLMELIPSLELQYLNMQAALRKQQDNPSKKRKKKEC